MFWVKQMQYFDPGDRGLCETKCKCGPVLITSFDLLGLISVDPGHQSP